MTRMLFPLGRLSIPQGKSFRVGDPCYFDQKDIPVLKVTPQWSEPYHEVYVLVESSSLSYHELPRPVALFLMCGQNQRDSFHHIPKLPLEPDQLLKVGEAGVDSGQVAFVTETRYQEWTEDMEYKLVCQSTLKSPLWAGATFQHAPGQYAFDTVWNAVTSSTTWGDGVYPIYAILDVPVLNDMTLESLLTPPPPILDPPPDLNRSEKLEWVSRKMDEIAHQVLGTHHHVMGFMVDFNGLIPVPDDDDDDTWEDDDE